MSFTLTMTPYDDKMFDVVVQNLDLLHSNELTSIGKKYETDKASTYRIFKPDTYSKSIEFDGHNYSIVYYELLKKYKNREFNLLELGAGDTGASAKMWREVFPNANITLFDPFFFNHSDITATPEELEKLNINVVIGNQLCADDLLKLVKHKNDRFDVIIDDAAHVSDGVQISLATLLHYLSDDGFYFIEDLSSMRDRDQRISDVNNWLDGPTIKQDIKKIYHKKETHIMDSIEHLRATGTYKADFLTEEQKTYLQNNIKYCACFRDFDTEHNLMMIKKQKASLVEEQWLHVPMNDLNYNQKFIRTLLD